MKRLIILFLLLFMPVMIFGAECDEKAHKDYINYASNISYENSYSKSSATFTVTLYNVIDGLKVKYNKRYYERNSDDTVTIDNIPEGTDMRIEIYDNEECGIAKVIVIYQLYFNPFYGTYDCVGFENKIRSCSAQFTEIKVTQESLEDAKSNLKVIVQDKEPEPEPESRSPLIEFMLNYGIKILLLIITCIVSIAIYSTKFRKIKHGI